MDRSYVIGRVWNELRKEFAAVIGYEFRDTPGFYQFYQVGSKGHFRKSPNAEQGDEVSPIGIATFREFELITPQPTKG